jgi:long-chain alkane monooxygenase
MKGVCLAQMLERGLFDRLFLGDVLGLTMSMGKCGRLVAHRRADSLFDPMAMVPAMAHATTRPGFDVTCNFAHEPPFLSARRMATLDHLTRSRIG